MVKASEPERIETYLLLRRCETISTVTTVSKLVDLLASTSSGELIDALTHFERRITSWEHDAKETLSDLINIGDVTKGLKRSGFSRLSVDQHCWHDKVDESFKRDRKLRSGTKRHTACTDGFVGDGQPRSEVPKKLFMVFYGHMARDCRKKTEYLQENQQTWMIWHGRQRQKQAWHGQRQR